jgi:cytochrome bd-type quinol oxidase subunit 2|tara:strand:- start:322 stop:627 length:306 start_codon:yes stop_codon:yes gene_type:complete
MAPEVVKTDLTTFKACLKLIQDAKSDTIKIAKQITIILENLSIVKSMILVSELLLLCIASSSYHSLFFFSNITLLCIVLLLFYAIFFFSTIQVKKDSAKSQ